MNPQKNWVVTEKVKGNVKETRHTSLTRAMIAMVKKLTGVRQFSIIVHETNRVIVVSKIEEAKK